MKIIQKEIKDNLGKILGPILESLVTSVLSNAVKIGTVYYGDELKGIAARSKLDLGTLVMLQLTYEASTCCTSVIVPGTSNQIPLHIRTMDWGGMDFLRSLTIEVEFQRGGKTEYVITTWAGYVGALTGMRPNGFSVSVNFRSTDGSFWTNFKKAVTKCWPVGFLVREILETVKDYKQAVGYLAASDLIAPCYFTIAGANKSQGTVLTRRPASEENRITLDTKPYLVQTNIDHWSNNKEEDILDSIKRRSLASNKLSELKTVNEESLWKLLSRDPLVNDLTIFGTFMCPNKGIFHTRLVDSTTFFKPFSFPEKTEDNVVYLNESSIVDETLLLKAIYKLPDPWPKCLTCDKPFDPKKNIGGECTHNGKWHSTYDDCNYFHCGAHLLFKGGIGKQHWSCCFLADYDSAICPKSGKHIVHTKKKKKT